MPLRNDRHCPLPFTTQEEQRLVAGNAYVFTEMDLFNGLRKCKIQK
jgi:hypothetical protein